MVSEGLAGRNVSSCRPGLHCFEEMNGLDLYVPTEVPADEQVAMKAFCAVSSNLPQLSAM